MRKSVVATSDDNTSIEARPLAPLQVSTLSSLVQTVQDHTTSDDEVVAVLSHMLSTRRVELGGVYAGKRIRLSAAVRDDHSF